MKLCKKFSLAFACYGDQSQSCFGLKLCKHNLFLLFRHIKNDHSDLWFLLCPLRPYLQNGKAIGASEVYRKPVCELKDRFHAHIWKRSGAAEGKLTLSSVVLDEVD